MYRKIYSHANSIRVLMMMMMINNSKFLKATYRTKIRKIEIPRSMVVEALSC